MSFIYNDDIHWANLSTHYFGDVMRICVPKYKFSGSFHQGPFQSNKSFAAVFLPIVVVIICNSSTV